MKFIVSTSGLIKHLQFSVGIISGKCVLPVADYFLFDLEKNKLKIISTDLETTLITELEVESNDFGKFLIPARLLIDTIKTFPEQPIIFKVDEKKYNVEMTTDNGKYKMTGMNAADFPKIPDVKGKTNVEMSSGVFKDAISKTLFACGKDELRPVMSGVFLDFAAEQLTFVGTDAHKLVRYRVVDLKTETPFSLIAPKKPLSIIKNELSGDESKVIIRHNDKHVFMNYNHITVVTRCVDGKYPNYDAVIPFDNSKKLITNKEQFLNSVRRVLIFSTRKSALIRLKIKQSELEINAEDIDFGNEAAEKLICQYEGEDIEIGFNGNTLLELLINIDTENVLMEMSLPNRASLMFPNGKNIKGDMLMLIMPMLIER